MASKILTGYMLELMENILNNLNNEIYSLHSCALSGTILHKLDLYCFDYELKPEIFYSLERNKQFFSQLHDLSLGGNKSDFNIKSATKLLEILAKNTTNISVLQFEGFDSVSEPQLFDAFISIIKSQKQLRYFTIFGGNEFPTESHGIISALESQKQSLQEFGMDFCTCTEEFKVLKDCTNLKILRIRYCEDVKILEPSVNTLDIINYPVYPSNLVPILKNSGSLLQRLRLWLDDDLIDEESVLIETLASFCPNITYLYIAPIEFSAQLVELIGNLQQLQFLTLGCIYYMPQDELEILFTQFAKTLPPTLQYLDLMYSTFTPYIHVLLNNSHAALKYLLINRFENKETIKALIEFCKRKRTLKYVGVKSRYLNDDLGKEVEGYVSLVPHERIVVNC
ncbi:hypothetical protein F8M41_005334 [Gigaspora margarita]|uniref:Uncharacterized protein n=1 Tax=Gigaspora margarita TaxID=4874 RepID=A0A8H4A603_GIGMA|nr:hypothetical protein F8M41_005334 [Gigaspora margarita]